VAIITISRGTFSGGKALAECAAAALGFRCIARRMLVRAAEDYDVPLEALSKALSDTPGILESMSRERSHYLAYIRAELLEAVKDENIVYHGLAGHLLLKDIPHVLRVKVIADMEYRIQAAMERSNLTRPDAEEFIRNIDAKRDKWIKFLYHVDRNNPQLYDLVINLEHVSMNTACDIIRLNASLPEYQRTPESQKRIDDLVFAAQVRAKIAAADITDDRGVEIDSDDGVIHIGGNVNNLVDADRLHEMIRDMPGVEDIISRLHIRDYIYTPAAVGR